MVILRIKTIEVSVSKWLNSKNVPIKRKVPNAIKEFKNDCNKVIKIEELKRMMMSRSLKKRRKPRRILMGLMDRNLRRVRRRIIRKRRECLRSYRRRKRRNCMRRIFSSVRLRKNDASQLFNQFRLNNYIRLFFYFGFC